MHKNTKILLTSFFVVFLITTYFIYLEFTRLNISLESNNASLKSNEEELSNKIIASNLDRYSGDSKLEKEIRELSKKIDALEKNTYKVEIGKPPPNVQWMDLKNWRKVKAGMYEDSVIKILGQPTKRSASAGQVTLSYFGYGKSASVTVGPLMVGVISWREPT